MLLRYTLDVIADEQRLVFECPLSVEGLDLERLETTVVFPENQLRFGADSGKDTFKRAALRVTRAEGVLKKVALGLQAADVAAPDVRLSHRLGYLFMRCGWRAPMLPATVAKSSVSRPSSGEGRSEFEGRGNLHFVDNPAVTGLRFFVKS